MAMALPDPEQTAGVLLEVAEALELDTPDPTDSYDVDTRRTEDAAGYMMELGENLRAAVERAGPERAEGLARALVSACREMLTVCATLEDEYYRAGREPGPESLLEHARNVLRLLDEHVRAIVVLNKATPPVGRIPRPLSQRERKKGTGTRMRQSQLHSCSLLRQRVAPTQVSIGACAPRSIQCPRRRLGGPRRR